MSSGLSLICRLNVKNMKLGVVGQFDKSEVGAHYRTERGPGSPAGLPRWGGGCAGC